MHKQVQIRKDGFASGQISSKLWMCHELERVISKMKLNDPQTIWLLGGWYAISAFLLLSRQNINIKKIRSFDLDESATEIADTLLENWVWQEWTFKAFTQDVVKLNYDEPKFDGRPDWVINTSCEHFEDNSWFDRVPKGCKLVLQSNNMEHEEHFQMTESLKDFQSQFSFEEVFYSEQKKFEYPDSSFTRYMIIAEK